MHKVNKQNKTRSQLKILEHIYIDIYISINLGSHASNATPGSGEDKEQTATNDTNHQGETLPDLIHVPLTPREQTIRDPMVRHSNGHEHHHRHHRVHEVLEPNLVPVVLGNRHVSEPRLENRQSLGCDEAVVDVAVGAVETVGEVEEEAGEGAHDEEEVDHDDVDVCALSVLVDRRENHLEG